MCGFSSCVFTRCVWRSRAWFVGGVVFSVVVPLCGGTSCVTRALGSILGRACYSCRMVIIGSSSASGDLRITSDFRSRQVRVCAGRGRNMSTTHGCNVVRTGCSCVTFLSTSSV